LPPAMNTTKDSTGLRNRKGLLVGKKAQKTLRGVRNGRGNLRDVAKAAGDVMTRFGGGV